MLVPEVLNTPIYSVKEEEIENTVHNQLVMKEVMADLRKEGARCCLLYTEHKQYTLPSEYPNKYVQIRAVLKDGRVWNIHEIKSCYGKNEAFVVSDTE